MSQSDNLRLLDTVLLVVVVIVIGVFSLRLTLGTCGEVPFLCLLRCRVNGDGGISTYTCLRIADIGVWAADDREVDMVQVINL